MSELSIGQAAERSGFSADTLRYYERIGLLPAPARTPGNRRVYRQRDLERLAFVQRAQAVGFSLKEIEQLVGFREDPAGSSRAVRELAARTHRRVRQRIENLGRIEGELALLLSICSGSQEDCPILEHLANNPGRPVSSGPGANARQSPGAEAE